MTTYKNNIFIQKLRIEYNTYLPTWLPTTRNMLYVGKADVHYTDFKLRDWALLRY